MSEEKLFEIIAVELDLNIIQVKKTVELLDADKTVPFIARYRKEHTGSLDENQIRQIQERIKYLRTVEDRKRTILKSIEEQGKLTEELQLQISSTFKLNELEDLYLPFKPKKKTRATTARAAGLETLAQIILAQEITDGTCAQIAVEYINPEKEINSAEDALSGACDIIAEVIAEDADIRRQIRELVFKKGFLVSKKKKDVADRQFEMYFDFNQLLHKIPPHRLLAINRGEKSGALKIEVETEVDHAATIIRAKYLKNEKSIFSDYINNTIRDSYQRLIIPSISREVRSDLTLKADKHAIDVFAVNLKNLLMQPPVFGKRIMGIDPGFRTGCKVAVIDETGKYLEGNTIYPHPPQKQYFQAKEILREMIQSSAIDIIAIGNGTASRETELMISELISEIKDEHGIQYIIVNEAGASVYSASEIAQKEFPDLEAAMRGNISIARRLQDPLAELVKIDPKSIGVGLYQHDVSQKELAQSLDHVVESCVNAVGVDINTASSALLTHVSGLNKRAAENIVSYREDKGVFRNREELKEIDGIGAIAFEQAAGFLRIRNGNNPLDATSIHPESYAATTKLLKKFAVKDIFAEGKKLHESIREKNINLNQLANEVDCGVPTLEDILLDLEKPGRDPRENLPKPLFRSDVLKMEDLRSGMILQGTVRNVVDFGVFVDIGVKQDGLIHVSELAETYVKKPHEFVRIGDTVQVRVISIDLERHRIALSMKSVGSQ
jgi:uncharacterized protein